MCFEVWRLQITWSVAQRMAGKRLVRVCGKRPPDAARALKLVADDAEKCGAICKKKKDLGNEFAVSTGYYNSG